ncbi:sugar transferase [Thalassiella azotivora]
MPDSFYARRLKRPLDVVGAIALGVVTSPLHVACAAAVLASSGRPVYFSQQRAGRDGEPFRLHKFRTMKVGTEQVSNNFPTPDMVTPVGRVLRRLSLDEIPQLYNIAVGDMSFVGPRPALVSHVARYTAHQRRRLTVRPGLTGLAQVRYRNNAPWSVRIESDLEYVDAVSARLDLKLVVLTARTVLFGTGQVVGQQAADVDDLAPAPPASP